VVVRRTLRGKYNLILEGWFGGVDAALNTLASSVKDRVAEKRRRHRCQT
jgi:hypothetical protein